MAANISPQNSADELEQLATLTVAAARFMSFYTIKTSRFKLKCALAKEIFWFAEQTDRIVRRISTLTSSIEPENWIPTKDIAIPIFNQDDDTNDSADGAICYFYETWLSDSLADVKNFERNTDLIGDEPSHLIVKSFLADLAQRSLQILEIIDGKRDNIDFVMTSSLNLRSPDKPGGIDSVSISARAPQADMRAWESNEATRDLLHQNITNLEVPTIEACARAILDFQKMPWGFVLDMGRQCWDEARHALLFERRLMELGGSLGDCSGADDLWEMVTDQPLGLRLALHQVLGEWIGVNGAAWFRDGFAETDSETSLVFAFVAVDEVTHCAFGNKWLSWLEPEPQNRQLVLESAAKIRVEWGHSADPLAPVFPVQSQFISSCGFGSELPTLKNVNHGT